MKRPAPAIDGPREGILIGASFRERARGRCGIGQRLVDAPGQHFALMWVGRQHAENAALVAVAFRLGLVDAVQAGQGEAAGFGVHVVDDADDMKGPGLAAIGALHLRCLDREKIAHFLAETPCIAAGQKDGSLILAQRRKLCRADGNLRPHAAHTGIHRHGDSRIVWIAVIAFHRILGGDLGHAGNGGQFLCQAFG
jgi:hypothetical protein